MHFFATHFWRAQEGGGSSLVLQQVYHRRKKIPIVLACICNNGRVDGSLAKGLIHWFYGEGLKLCRKGERGIDSIERGFVAYVEQALAEERGGGAKPELIGMLLVGQCFVMVQKGGLGAKLLNQKNHRSHCRSFVGREVPGEEISVRRGRIQKGVGVLLTTAVFDEGIGDVTVEECLEVRSLRSQERLERQLRELGTAVAAKGAGCVGAVLIVAQ